MSTIRIIDQECVKAVLTMKDCIEANATAFASMVKGTSQVPLRSSLQAEKYEGFTKIMPGYVPGQALGLKVVSVRPPNAAQGLPVVMGFVNLVNEATGAPLALMDATYLTAVRTAAGSGAATERLARKDASVVAVFGAGAQAEQHIHAMCCVRPIKEVHIVNRTQKNAADLASRLASVYPDVKFHADTSADDAVKVADIICTGTNSSTPVFKGALLKPGSHINAVGSYRPTMQEIDSDAVCRAKVVADQASAVLAECGDLLKPLEEGRIQKDHIVCDLGHVVEGKEVRSSDEDITMFKSTGLAIQDIFTADLVYRKCVEQNLGMTVPWN